MTTAALIPNRGRLEADRLTLALLNLTSRGLRPHCSDPTLSELWLSEIEGERAEAVKLCAGCPVLRPCADVGQHQTFGVFGGVDRTKKPRKAVAA